MMKGALVLWIQVLTIFVYVYCVEKDVIFMIDTSISVFDDDVKASLKFIADVTQFLNIGPHQCQVSIVLYNTKAESAFKLDAYQTKATLLSAIHNVSYSINGSTDAAQALNFTQSMFSVLHGGRSSAEKAVVVLTDGRFNDEVSTKRSSNSLTSNNVTVYGVLLGNYKQDMDCLTTKQSNIFSVSAYNYICNLVPELVPNLDPSATYHLPSNCTPPPSTTTDFTQSTSQRQSIHGNLSAAAAAASAAAGATTVAAAAAAATTTTTTKTTDKLKGAIAGTFSALFLLLLCLFLLLVFRKKLRNKKTAEVYPEEHDVIVGLPPQKTFIR